MARSCFIGRVKGILAHERVALCSYLFYLLFVEHFLWVVNRIYSASGVSTLCVNNRYVCFELQNDDVSLKKILSTCEGIMYIFCYYYVT